MDSPSEKVENLYAITLICRSEPIISFLITLDFLTRKGQALADCLRKQTLKICFISHEFSNKAAGLAIQEYKTAAVL